MVISLLVYLATFSEELYFCRSHFLTLPQSNCFDTTVTLPEQLFFQSGCFFWGVPFSKEPFPCSSYFFRIPNFSERNFYSSHFLIIGSSLGQLLFGTVTFLPEELLNIKITTEELLCRSRYFCAASAFSEELHFQKI